MGWKKMKKVGAYIFKPPILMQFHLVGDNRKSVFHFLYI